MTHPSSLTTESGQTKLPNGFDCINGKLYFTDTNGNLIVLSNQLISPIALTKSADGKSGYGVVFAILIDNKIQEIFIDAKVVFSGATKIFAELADAGINISPSQVKIFKEYIQACMSMPNLPQRLTLEQTGLVPDRLVFAIGKQILIGKSGLDIEREYTMRAKSAEGFTVQGTFND